MSLEIENGYARLLMDYGTGTVSVDQKQIKLTDGKPHKVDIIFTRTVCICRRNWNSVFFFFLLLRPVIFLFLFTEHRAEG